VTNLQFKYTNKPISSYESLSKTLSISIQEIHDIESKSNDFYTISKKIKKPDGSLRVTYKVHPRLRCVLDLLKKRVFDSVEAPEYILAGQKNRSYILNAKTHTESQMLLCEDIKSFFPSIHKKFVKKIFQHFFFFSPDISESLAEISTLNNYLVQGSPLSGEIANLIFFDLEPALVERLKKYNLRYTRYYDDIYISSKEHNFYEHTEEIKRQIYRMFNTVNLKPNRKKNKISKQSSRISVHNITVNSSKISPSKERLSMVRKKIYIFKCSIENNIDIQDLIGQYKSLQGHISTLKTQEYTKHKITKRELELLISKIDERLAKKYSRKFRSVKTKENFNKLANSSNLLTKISPRVTGVYKDEKMKAKKRLWK